MWGNDVGKFTIATECVFLLSAKCVTSCRDCGVVGDVHLNSHYVYERNNVVIPPSVGGSLPALGDAIMVVMALLLFSALL